METSSAVVGSSAMMSSGSPEGDGDHHPLAHATGELVRILPDAHIRVPGSPPPHQLEGLGKAASRDRSVLARMVSTSCCSTVNSGLREVMGSWKMKPMREPQWPASRSGSCRR